MVIKAAQEGHVQTYLVILSFFASSFHFLMGQSKHSVQRNGKRGPYELINHVLRVSSFASLYLSPLAAQRYSSTILALAYISFLGVATTQSSSTRACHLLQQMVLLSIATFALMFTAQVVPLLVIGSTIEPDQKALVSTALLFLSIFVSSITPRDWVTPVGHPEAIKSGPSQEETASWLDYWCTFGRLTPLIAKGWDGKITPQDLASLPWDYQPKALLQRIMQLRQKHKSTARTLLAFLWLDLSIAATSASMFFITELIQPLGMYYLLDYLANPAEAVFRPYLWLFVIMFGKLFGTIV